MAEHVIIPKELCTAPFKDAWEEWKAHRSEMRKRFTDRAQRMALKKLATLGPEAAIAAIEHSIANGYQGIFPDPNYKPNPARERGAGPTGHREPNEQWRDAAKAACSEDPQYWQHCGFDSHRIQQLTTFYGLPQSLRQATLQAANRMRLNLWK
ncbi:hypothetical protein [Cerasicoccus maritimus]|uniref:hypothetical protein n=1 Tax=Cerasicoccus maritimus TaxID=490089 RepID=UPI0028529510|nr:hypothetical protein [Cerasicoccus maritimus]